MARDVGVGELYRCAYVAVREHYSLRCAGGSGGVVDYGEGVEVFVVYAEGDIVLAEALRVFLFEGLVQILVEALQFGIAAEEEAEVVGVEGCLDLRHKFRLELVPDFAVGEEDEAVGVVNELVHGIRVEIGQNRDDYGAVSCD